MSDLDREFIARQKLRLLEMRRQLTIATPAELEEWELLSQAVGESKELEEDAQRRATLEVDARLVARDLRRRAAIDRALRKIEEGSYGFSDASGEPIGKARLDVAPEAVYSLADAEARERRARVGIPERA
jgi:DnaK suppressor protein